MMKFRGEAGPGSGSTGQRNTGRSGESGEGDGGRRTPLRTMEIPSALTGIWRDPVFQVAHSLPAMATLLMTKKTVRQPQSADCLESLK